MERVAIIGSGVAGSGCAWNLRDVAKLTIFEQDPRPGGHTNTVDVDEVGQRIPIDTGFIVFNRVTYPNLCALFEELGVATQPSEMSFSVQHLPDGLEYNGMSFAKVFAQKRNLFRPRFHRLLSGIMRFFKVAMADLESPEIEGMTVRDFARRHQLSDDVLGYYLIPMSSAVWSTRPNEVLDFPAQMLIRFFYNHGFLGVKTHHPWFTVSGGARSYLEKIYARIGCPRLSAKVVGVRQSREFADVRTADGNVERFDRVVIAAHGDQALAMLENPSAEQEQVLGAFRYQKNQATLHTDASWMPRRRIAWASWNYRIDGGGDEENPVASTHYWMNALQNVSENVDYFVSINCADRIDPAKKLYETEYDHPAYTVDAIRAQRRLPALNASAGLGRVYFCGSYHRYGFHEDAYWSGRETARVIQEVLAR